MSRRGSAKWNYEHASLAADALRLALGYIDELIADGRFTDHNGAMHRFNAKSSQTAIRNARIDLLRDLLPALMKDARVQPLPPPTPTAAQTVN